MKRTKLTLFALTCSLVTAMAQTNSFPFQLLIASVCAVLLAAHLPAADSPHDRTTARLSLYI
jgi:hypothetical protein